MHYLMGICPNCGKEFFPEASGGTRKYCSVACWREFTAKKAEKREKQKKKPLSDTLVPQERCRTCIYGQKYGAIWHCGYFLQLDTTRTALHPEGLTSDCKEYKRKGRTQKQ